MTATHPLALPILLGPGHRSSPHTELCGGSILYEIVKYLGEHNSAFYCVRMRRIEIGAEWSGEQAVPGGESAARHPRR
jgi:hypothetical protein